MSRTTFLMVLGIGLAVMAAGCIFTTDPVVISDPPGVYSDSLTHPDSLINDLMVSYRRKEIGPYANLLGKEFIFHFLPTDAGDIPDGVWNKDQDSTGTYNLFTDPGVSRITIDLEWNAPVPDEIRGEAVQRVDVNYVDLKVDIDGGATTLAVPGDRQLFYFQKGDEPGEDPGRWYLVDWEDLGGQAGGKPTRESMRPLSERVQTPGTVYVTMSELMQILGSRQASVSP